MIIKVVDSGMLPPLIDINPFREAIERDCLILTPNHRLAAKINDAWAMAVGKAVWRAPRVYSIDHWLKYCWDELQDQNHALVSGLAVVGTQQSRYYWERAITKDDPAHSNSYAKIASDTLKTVQNWNLSADQIPSGTPAVEYFKRWTSSYEELLEKNKLISQQFSWQLIQRGFECAALPTEAEILLYGFQSIPPLQAQVIETASSSIIKVEGASNKGASNKGTSNKGDCNKSAEIYRLECEDPQTELRRVANWAAQQLREKPNQRLGIIVPDLNNRLQQVARVVNEALKSEETEMLVNISAGTALADTAVVNAALELIATLQYKRPLNDWLQLLYSPYSAFDQLTVQYRADCELALRKTRRFEFNLEQFLSAILPAEETDQTENEHRESILAVLQPLIDLKRFSKVKTGTQKNFSGWAQFFNQFLTAMGWPGERSLHSIEYQQRQQWDSLIEQFCTLDNLAIEVGLASALKHLQQLAKESVFHPKTADAPLQILGLLEGSGLNFDQLWIVGMHSQNFPASVAINPMLPADFQREHGMPHSLPERELQIAQELLSGYKNNSRRLILSYPLQRGEEQLDPSPLIRDITLSSSAELFVEPEAHPLWLRQPQQCELIADQAPAYNPANENIRGGSRLLENQAICPFNAFATHRLKAEPLEEPVQGLSAMDRGSLIHEILFRLWTDWKSSDVLNSLSEQQLSDQLSTAIADTLIEWAPHHSVLRGDRFRALEQQRLEKLLHEWIDSEKQREPFEVASLESSASIRFGDLNISLRFDRVDQIGDKLLIIDYKTGQVKPKKWSGLRPLDPQLPLYLLASKPQANGCAFAQLRAGDIKFIGSSDSQLVSGEKPADNWSDQIDQWQSALTNLATEFSGGYISVEVHDKSRFDFQDYLLPLNRWPEESEINASINSSKAEKDKS